MIPSHLDFKRLKQTVTIEQVLADRGLLDLLSKRGARLVGPCPLHGGDNPTAFVVDTHRNIWHCFTGCASGGDIVEMARRLCDGTFSGAARYLARLAGNEMQHRFTAEPRRSPLPFLPFTRRLPLDPKTAFLAQKGITPQTARRYEVGTYHGLGMLEGCVGVRLFDPEGRPLGYAGRRLDPGDVKTRGKWVFPPRLPKKTLLYGYHQVRHLAHRPLVVVECPWGVLRLAQLAIPAVALLGTSLSQNQCKLLSNWTRIFLLLDGDRAGKRATESIQGRLPHAISASLPNGCDPDDLSDDRLRDVLPQTNPLSS